MLSNWSMLLLLVYHFLKMNDDLNACTNKKKISKKGIEIQMLNIMQQRQNNISSISPCSPKK